MVSHNITASISSFRLKQFLCLKASGWNHGFGLISYGESNAADVETRPKN
jgi:hypothetical protein